MDRRAFLLAALPGILIGQSARAQLACKADGPTAEDIFSELLRTKPGKYRSSTSRSNEVRLRRSTARMRKAKNAQNPALGANCS
jgi:hypothetical protein